MKNSIFLLWLQLICSLGAYTFFVQMFGWSVFFPLFLFHFAINLQIPIREAKSREMIEKLLQHKGCGCPSCVGKNEETKK